MLYYFLELDISNHKYSVPYFKQTYRIIEADKNGISQGKLAKIMGLTKLQSRTILRNIVKKNMVATYMNDIGRQRLTKYVSKRYEKTSNLSKQFKEEIHKIKEFTKQITTESDDLEKTKMITQREKNTIINNEEKESMEINKDNSIQKTSNTKVTIELQKIFYVVNRILYKYCITMRPNRYKRTFCNYLSCQTNKIPIKEKNLYSNNILSQISELSKDEKAVAVYNNIKVDLTILKSTNEEKPENEMYGFLEDVQNSEKRSVTNITYRLLRRANMIIQSVKEHQVIDDMTKLMKVK